MRDRRHAPHLADELGSLASGFLFAGASSVISTYWRVRDASALLFSDLFYTARRRRDASLAHCLDTAARTLRTMSEQEAYARLTGLLDTYDEVDVNRRRRVLAPFLNARDDHRPFTSPVDWAAFFLTGRP
ncbi:CHAT domain-containing protein [Streptomyces kanamyceticus]|uniref:CHAT domain-containing protein n=1 Tax=Streptomyces kanamyceticus TaxID=1967 RepID=UPI0037DDB7A4